MLRRQVLRLGLAFGLAPAAARAQVTEGDDAPLRFGRFEHAGQAFYGFLSAGGIHELSGSFFDPDTHRTGTVIPLEEVRILVPVEPGKVLGVAFNYKGQEAQGGAAPLFFAKLPSSLTGHDGEIVPPPGSSALHFEGEMAVVIGARGRDIAEADALSYVFGVTCGNDVTEHGLTPGPFTMLQAKAGDTMAPLGPWIVPGLGVGRLRLETRLNGKVVQTASTADLIHPTARLIAALSRFMTLEPGDVIYTGTPAGGRAMQAGDTVEVSLEGVGTLRNTVAGGKP